MSASKSAQRSKAVQQVANAPKDKGNSTWNGVVASKAESIAAAKQALKDGMISNAEYAAMRQQIEG